MNTRRIKTLGFVFVIYSVFNPVFSQEAQFSTGLFSGEHCSILTSENVFSIQTNPARIANCDQTEIGVAYSTSYYTTNTLCSRINACTPLKQNVIGTSLVVFGNSHFRETHYDLCIARNIFQHYALSVKFDIQQTYQDEYGRTYSILPELAFFGGENKIFYGIHLINPLQIRTNATKNVTISKIQAGYYINKEFCCIAQLQQRTINTFMFSFGLQYNIQEKITVALQYDNHEQPINIMITIPYRKIRCYLETNFNYFLGITNCIAFEYLF